jgi:hypothetical protein
MKTNMTTLVIPELKMKLSNRGSVRKVELWEFYYLLTSDLTAQRGENNYLMGWLNGSGGAGKTHIN